VTSCAARLTVLSTLTVNHVGHVYCHSLGGGVSNNNGTDDLDTTDPKTEVGCRTVYDFGHNSDGIHKTKYEQYQKLNNL